MNTTTRKNHLPFLGGMALFALACFVRYFRSQITHYNTTLFAMNYDYGFISRGFLGTFWKWLDGILPYDLMTYTAVYNFTGLCTVIYFICLFWFYKTALKHSTEKDIRNQQHLIVFLSVFAFPMFVGKAMFGRLDVYLFIFMLIGMVLIIKEKFEWLIIPMGIICMCIHQGFVFTNANTLLVMLFYKILLGKPEKRKQYIAIFALFFLSISALFLYFEFFSHVNGEAIVEEVKANAKLLSQTGTMYNPSIINHEILGKDVFLDEIKYHNYNMQDFPVFIVLFAPYIYYGFRFFFRLVKDKNITAATRVVYFAFLMGGATMVPQFLLKVDYGRYMFHLIFYYVSLLIAAMAMGDNKVGGDLDSLKAELKKLTPLTFIWFLYPLLLTPFKDVTISTQIHNLAEMLFVEDVGVFLIPGLSEVIPDILP